ncbi:MAG: terpene cyclase/mutase family protein, partial [Planctomycetaceae bacterium]|nr:terpene cyclase/mutase family protein [Planctomycetaceae bacterium]
GIPVPAEIIERAKQYIADCTTEDGGVQYSIMRQGGPRPPITAAALAAMFNSGEYEGKNVKLMLDFCEKNIWPGGGGMQSTFGHWHYAHYYYAQVMYRLDDDKWKRYSREINDNIIRKQSADGSWQEGHVGPVYTTAMNATILQLDKGYLPIFQR